MSVNEPDVGYKCHPKIFGLNSMPSHHPIKDGKMVCSIVMIRTARLKA
jgi:hypothetical protein